MAYREDFLRTKLKQFLERRSMPRQLDGKPQAIAEEIQALAVAVGKFAPRGDYEDWWPRFIERLDEESKTRAWPTAFEMKNAAKGLSGPVSKHMAEGNETDPLEINAKRMNAGDPVGDGYLYGRLAAELLAKGLVSEATMRAYRSGLFFNAKAAYGEEGALKLEAEWKDRHEDALAAQGARTPRNLPQPSPNKMTAYEWDGAE